ncbi:MAG TPA: tetratricopeptide repeat protein [Candidatus Sulfotelmatobacter sp.]|jgi:tetratricopeptide (TPR) repeat protein|nr:tetratricopeptide repeat protein [Candidatus Sulfotelmatobacter sp.]
MVKWTKTYALAAILALGMLGCFATRAAAQEGKMSGTIIDFDGNPWANLPVKIKSDVGAISESKTDAAGKFAFSGLKNGKYTFTVQTPQMQAPFDVLVEVRGADTPPVNLNFKEILEKQNPEAAAKYKQQQAEQKKFAGMKEQFAKGVALLDQERAAKAELTKAKPEEKDALKAKIADLSNQAVTTFQDGLKAAPEKDPNIHLFWARMGEAYDLAGRNDEAINAYQQAITAKPDNPSYYNNLGNILGRTGKIDEARAAYTKCAELDPPNAAMAWRNFGISLYQAGRMVEAIEPLKKATELDPKNAQSWYLLGACMVADPSIYKTVGSKIEVNPRPGTIEAYQKAIDLDPNGTWGTQAKQGLEQLQQLTGGIETKVGNKKKKP